MPVGRMVSISVVDLYDQPAGGAQIELTLNGQFAGTIDTGSGTAGPMTLEVRNPEITVALKVTVLGVTQAATLRPGQDTMKFVFPSVPQFATRVPPVVRCPDGTTGSPCVVCRDGGEFWKLCA